MIVRVAAAAFLISAPVWGQSSFRPLPKAALVGRTTGQPVEAGANLESRAIDAQVDSVPVIQVAKDSRELPKVSLDLFASADLDGTFETGMNSLETRRGGWRASIVDHNEDRILSFEGGVEGTFYQFSGAPPLGSITSDPFNDLYRTWVGGSYSSQTDTGEIGAFGGVEVTFGGEDEVGATDGVTIGGAGGWHYRASDDLLLSAGLAATSRLEDSARIWPFLGFDWALSKDWNLSILGPDIELGWQMNERWRSSLEVGYDLRQYRLNEEGPTQGAAFRDEAVRMGGGLQYSPNSSVQLSVNGGLSLWRELSLHETSGASSEVEIDPAPYIGFQLVFGF